MLQADLHCHSDVSDGLLSPAELARRAAANGVELLALTDHDDLGGLAAAGLAAAEVDMRFVDGVEISVSWGELTLHIVGLGIDPQDEVLDAGLAGIRAGRVERAARIAEALAEIGIRGALEGASRYAHNPRLIGRTHFARYLVEAGAARDVRGVFERYLVSGKPGHVTHRWADIEAAVSWILGAGGVAVLAHPGRYRVGRAELKRTLGAFKDCGGIAIEVVSGVHSPDQVRDFTRLAREFGFEASCGSDFHGPGESLTELGRAAPLPEGLEPVWRRFL